MSLFDTLPKTAAEAHDWVWAQYAPFGEDLLARDLSGENLDAFMRDWTALSDVLSEVQSRAAVATTLDTTDKEAEEYYLNFYKTIYPNLAKLTDKLNRILIDSGLVPQNYDVPLRYVRTEVELFREENLPLITELQELTTQYDKIIGAQTVTWHGEEKTLAQMRPVFLNGSREEREQAFTLVKDRRLQDRQALNELWVKMFRIRQQMAKNAGFNNFLDYTWKNYGRLDYTPADVQQFHQAIGQVVVPAVERLNEKLKHKLDLDTLKQWDTEAKDSSVPHLKPFTKGDELADVSARIFQQVDPDLGGYFQTMRDEDLLNLDNYKGKAPGGYCTGYSMVKRPFIFMNSVGLHDDVQTMLHEAGHAFHVFEAADWPYVGQNHAPIEFCEVASMSMELIAAPYLKKADGGFYSESEAARARMEHLEGMLVFWPYMAVVDAFQQWAYTSGEAALDPANCDAKWTELWHRFKKGVDYIGQEDWVATGWQRKLHIFTVPLYYIEYGIAQLGAAQVWANSLTDQAEALAAYRRGLSLGNTGTLPQLFEAAGAKLSFDAETLSRMVDLIEKTIDELDATVA